MREMWGKKGRSRPGPDAEAIAPAALATGPVSSADRHAARAAALAPKRVGAFASMILVWAFRPPSKMPSPWLRTKARGLPSSTIAPATKSHSMR
jgi:hypothetical protein